jgi:hypothetical protein
LKKLNIVSDHAERFGGRERLAIMRGCWRFSSAG